MMEWLDTALTGLISVVLLYDRGKAMIRKHLIRYRNWRNQRDNS